MKPLMQILIAVGLLAGLSLAPGAGHAQTAFNAGQLGTAPVSKQVRTFRDLRFRELMPQQYDFSCGSAALGSVLQYGYGIETDEQEMIRRMMVGVDPRQVVQNGFSMLDMKRYV